MRPIITAVDFSYKKSDSDVWVLNLDDIPLEKSKIKDQQLVHFGPQSVGGNHTHARTEWFIGIGELLFVWVDAHGNKHEEPMNPGRKLVLIEVPPFLPHAVVNTSHVASAVMFELADAKAGSVERVQVWQPTSGATS